MEKMEMKDLEMSASTSAEKFENDGESQDAQSTPAGLDVKNIAVKSVHIPYILNGELYEIQTQEGENVTVRCCHCPPDRVYRGSVRSTGNFHMHIKRRHPDLLGKLHDMKVSALLERRDRLMKNRKVSSHRSCRNRTKSHEQTTSEAAPPPPPPSPKLKIKSAFQRHQFQQLQQQQQQQRQQITKQQQLQHQDSSIGNWGLTTPFVVVPIAEATTNMPQVPEPINYSIKEDNSSSSMGGLGQAQQPIQIQENDLISMQMLQSSQSQSESLLTISAIQQAAGTLDICDCSTSMDRTYEGRRSPSSVSSNSSSCGSNISVGGNNNNHHLFKSISIVKNEVLMPEQAIDLTLNTPAMSSTSGIASTESITERSFQGSHCSPPTVKWNEMVQQLDSSLREIQREMRTRNEIETNRIFLEIAKFKYLHPGFTFQC